jgi:ribosomal protein S1
LENLLVEKKSKLNKKDPVIILKTVKGGYYAYYSGIYGFLPKSQY